MALIFDLDGTLLDSLQLHKKGLEYGFNIVLGKGTIPYGFLSRRIRYPAETLFELVSKKIGRNLTATEIKRIMAEKQRLLTYANIKKVRFYKGVCALIKLLMRNKIKFCIATAMNTKELRKFKRILKLNDLSKIIVNPDSPKHAKPDPYILNKAIRLLKVNKTKSVYIGDSPYDAVTAKRAEIGFIGVFNREELNKYEFYSSIEALLRMVQKNLFRFED